MSPPLLLGHRGARATRTIPENTLESFDLALAHGCDGFEFDVRMTADGQPVICHDATSEGREVAGTNADDLKDLARLETVLARYAGQAFLDIELKVAGLEQILLHTLKSHPPQRGFVISSFLPKVLRALHALDAGIPLGLICETQSQLAAWRSLPVQYVIPHHALIDSAMCKMLHSEAKEVFVWTVNRAELMTQFREINVDAFISDDTELLVETIGNRKE